MVRTGLGIIARNWRGKIVKAKGIVTRRRGAPAIEEAMAIRSALEMATNAGWTTIEVQSDCKCVKRGHPHMLGKNPDQDLAKLDRKHGPITCMRFGYVPAIIFSSPEAAEKFLKTYDQVFASRPHHEGSWYIAHELRNSTFGQYGTFWRNMRKLCILRLLSNYKIKLFLPMRIGEIGILVKSLKQAAFHGAAVNHSAAISSLGANMNCLMIFGKMCMDKDFNDRGLERSLKKHCMLQQWLTSVITFPSFVCLIFRDLHVG
nr:cytochrome P450 CYP736A12-like [Coffea arabica]